MGDSPGSQLLAHNTGQRAAKRLGQISQAQLGGIQLVAGSQSHDQRNLHAAGGQSQINLAADQIDGIDDVVIPAAVWEAEVPMLRVVGALDGMDDGTGVDLLNPGCGCLGFGQSNGRAEGQKLTVEVGQGDDVTVHHSQLTDAGPGQTLHHIAAHTAQSQDQHMGAGQTGLGSRSPKHFISDKTFVHPIPPKIEKREPALVSKPALCNLPLPEDQPTNFIAKL